MILMLPCWVTGCFKKYMQRIQLVIETDKMTNNELHHNHIVYLCVWDLFIYRIPISSRLLSINDIFVLTKRWYSFTSPPQVPPSL